ncbi:type I restriction endonuclease subunit R [Dysgonomonas sp. Marseille-P4677]|uniref:type I restriction endonuclease subunit R n=1 Tax=Dysgonomonas sp. Marseille-P4677 TaxID=2364790 RepID=UPI001913343C|nr:DEAD/DEAH box helicase family protein [Dysgonomonas sp. Marseille-P4677]MBK5720194.1 type I restriction endonuclease subunit R [Dysgonomonas sp. Marseille-P4677]
MTYTTNNLNGPNEAYLENLITSYLADSPLYNQRKASDFDIARMCDLDMLQRFIEKGQPNAWNKLIGRFGDNAMNEVVKEYNKRLDNGIGLLKVLREGFTLQGIKIKLLQFKPDQQKNLPFVELYQKNCFSVVRQMRYSNSGNDRTNELDLVILINGIPFLTCELKNEFTGQNIVNGMTQYRTSRDMNNRFLRNCLVHFVIDNNRVMMTTKLANEDTQFLPFNIDTENPIVEGDYATSYMWKDIFQADSLLNILQDFIKQYIPRSDLKKRVVTIFPRYHQLRCVRRIMSDVKEKGIGHNYLVQHSAGSGKSKSIAWLAHQLSDLFDNEDKPIFDSIIVVTDRIVLDKAISDEIHDFETVAGVVKSVQKGSQKLADALEKGYRVIVTTIQKFGNARKHLDELRGSRFAIIIDEAHSSQNGENAKDLKLTLTDKDLLQSIVDKGDPDIENDFDRLISEIQAARQNMPHISYFAFTATPKEQTLNLFGHNGEAFDVYSMRQAIEEGFIIDVLENYITFKSLFELVNREQVPDENQEEYDKKKALRLMMQYVNDNPYVITYKANMMLNHFMTKTIHKIEGKAKAMVVTSSRAHAVRYKQALDQLINEKYNGQISTLVAFSGTVEINEHKYTEENMNGFGIKDAAIRDKFKEDHCRILIVANKFQTGFDQPLLHTMFVDKQLGGVQAIQTLSRLNRCYTGKKDTMVIDFVNEQDQIQKAFQPYYQTTRLSEEANTQQLYDYKLEIDNYKVFGTNQIEEVIAVLMDKNRNPEELSPFFRSLVQDHVEPMEKAEQAIFRKQVNRYVRRYVFLSQLMTFIDPELEKYYLFCKLLYKFLPYTKDTLPLDVLERINLDKFKIEERENGSILLEEEDGKLGISDATITKTNVVEFATLHQLLEDINEPYAGFLEENDKLIYSLLLEVLADKEIQEAFNAQNTVDILIELIKDKFTTKSIEKMSQYFSLMDVMSSNQAFSETFFRKAFEFLAAATMKGNRPDYDEEKLKQLMYDNLVEEFSELAGVTYRELEEVIDWLFKIFNATTVESLDGLNDTLKDTFNNLYRSENRDLDLQIYFQTLVTKYEAFLRKIYYMREHKELESESRTSGLVHVVQQFADIQKLYKTTDEKLSNMHAYYNMLYQWRNDQAHMSPILKTEELTPALHAIAVMYVYAAMVNATDLEINGY